MPLTQAEEEELLKLYEAERRDDAKKSLASFVRSIDVPGAPAEEDNEDEFYPVRVEPAEHHLLLIDALEKVECGEIRRCMFLLPPGAAKSTYVSVVFPSWYLGKRKNREIICTSYGASLPKKFGRRCRTIVSSEEYKDIFGFGLDESNAAVDDWSLENGGHFYAIGVLGGVTGNRADGLICDDLIKGREDADSIVVRDKTWEAYKSDHRTRLKPGGFICFVATRWNEDDPCGRILPEDYNGESGWIEGRDGESWYVICIQAECERADDPLNRKIGEFLWPEWFTGDHFKNEKIVQGPRNWNALFQQRPAPEEGNFFKAEWIRYYDERPKHLRFYGASDYAVTKDDGDYTVHGVGGVDPDDDLYIIDWWRRQTASDIWIESFLDLSDVWNPLQWAEEKGQIIKSLEPFIKKRILERESYVTRIQFASSNDKITRAQAIRARFAQGKVYLPRNAAWTAELVREILLFPAGRNDDQVDVLSLFGRMLAKMIPGVVPANENVKRDRWNAAFDRAEEDTWRVV